MSELQLRRWTKHGHDRLYAKTARGLDLGWVDLRSGRSELNHPGMGIEIMAAVERWKREHPGWSQAKQQRPAHLSRSGRDLATNRPGEALRAKAASERIQNPVLRTGARLLGVKTRDQSWRSGAKGERKVGRRLDRLEASGWRVLHNVELAGGGDVDHLVIGRFGVFTINTKHHPGYNVAVRRRDIVVGRYEQDYVAKAHREAERTGRALMSVLGQPVNVTPLVVIDGHDRLRGWLRHRPQGVQVLPSWAARWWFRLPGRALLSTTEVESLHEIACDPATWT